jgi:hypothetical protein
MRDIVGKDESAMRVEISRKLRPAVWLARFIPVAAFFAAGITQTSRLAAQKAQVTQKDVLQIFESKCLQCHGEALKMANLDLRTRESRPKPADSSRDRESRSEDADATRACAH